ncbi:helix-turn-helix domain-containing protein [Streptomyces sp. B1I3]|uniref:helix-turn-helix domain-containing protein n=1 Tax=Streptomyces sp. B1I3 TaxID=3042264 RepID=UPI002783CF62|nr:helix-turn-helix domain-containing protein [Streptomyces sp. B1I3]MDQ0795609.1 transcriptional regulator with XRE-family HTH domain [Streptomyces sp. B1I3]
MAEHEGSSKKVVLLTVNQVVAHNLTKARRARGWTQDETAERLQRAAGKKWTAATLSAAERSLKTGRSRMFDANEVMCFARVFSEPVAYFFMPIEVPVHTEIIYRLGRGEDAEYQKDAYIEADELLEAAVPLRYSSEMISSVNRILKQSKGVVWSPSARVEWLDGGEDYEEWLDAERRREHPDELDEEAMETLRNFARLMSEKKTSSVLKALAQVMDSGAGEPPSSVPF